MSATMTAGTRKTLADQIDRLDSILDGLADAIPETVADAVREAVAAAVREAVAAAVREAVQTAVAEVLTNPEVLARVRDGQNADERPEFAFPPAPVAAADPEGRRPSRVRSLVAAAAGRVGQARAAARPHLARVRAWAGRHATAVRRWRTPLAAGAGAAAVTVLTAHLAGPLAAAGLCGAAAFALAAARRSPATAPCPACAPAT